MWKFLRITFWVIASLAAIIGVLRLTSIRWWQVPDGDPYLDASLEPTLHGGDWVILWRATAPKFGDLVLCPEPKTSRPTIARVMAEAGDHVQISGSSVTTGNTLSRTESKCGSFRTPSPSSGANLEQDCWIEVVNGKLHPRGNIPPDAEPKPDDVQADVPPGQVFLVSDNRLYPWDSREFGTVERAQCAETIVFRLVSKGGFFDVSNRFSVIR